MSEAGMGFLELSHVKKQFGTFAAVEDFVLSAAKGEFVSFLGPSGCGKTTTLRMIAGFEYPDSGSIKIDGKEITRLPPNKRNVGMVFQAYALFPNMTVANNVGFGMRIKKQSKEVIRKRVGELLELINMPEKADRYPYQLSGGQQQRVALARALAIEPQVLLLDEPLSALDAKIRVALRAEIRSIQRHLGITTVYVTHDQEEALSLSDRVVVMSQGRIEQIGNPFEIYNFPSTAFVASFVGTLNALEAEVVDAPGGIVAVGGQRIRLPGPAASPAGSTVEIALRPEILTLRESGPEANRLSGTVLRVTFLGSIVRVRITLDGSDRTVAFDTLNNPHLAVPAEEERVTVSFAPEAVLVLDASARELKDAAAMAEDELPEHHDSESDILP
jgi:putative spermidine/putrescine transport system ATP-binding protein